MSPLSPAPVRIDADLYEDLANPARQAAYPKSSRSYVRVDISIRTYWHTLFDAVPQLLELSGPDGRAIFLPFMEWAREEKLSLNWAFFLWVYEWLLNSEFRDRLDSKLLIDMMAASASRWTGRDRNSRYRLIVLGTPFLSERKAVAGWKISSLETQHIEVEQVEFDAPLPIPDGNFGYFALPGTEIDCFPGWQPIPR